MKGQGPLDWDVLRKDVADVERELDWDDGLSSARARFLLHSNLQSARPKRETFRFAWTGLALAACIVLAIGGWQRHRQNAPLSFEAGPYRRAGQVGALLSVEAEPMPVHFSDGTSISVAPATRARVTETSPRGAALALEEGSLSVAVRHRDASEWHVTAGPFTVLVTGTKFDVRWSAKAQAFALDLHEGSVTVLGPSLGLSGRRVEAGESIRVSIAESDDAPAPPTGATGDMAAGPPTAPDNGPPIGPGNAPKAATPDAIALHGAWKPLALEARYADALAAAEKEGFDAACRRASNADLLLLGDAARFAGSTKRAEQALQMVRARPGAKHEAAMSAFTLGRMAYDRKSYRDAARWFQSYLAEEPAGGVAREAAGRLIEAQRSAGEVAAARDSANAYLARYPAGPHAALARDVLGR